MGRSITVQEAIRRGIKEIEQPFKVILTLSIAISIVMALVNSSFGYLFLIPVGVVLSLIYTSEAKLKWRTWAYENVEDIHQLQRSAELAGLLTIGSHERNGNVVHKRFLEESVFIDDFTIPVETPVYMTNSYSKSAPLMVLSDRGIAVQDEGLFEWNEIHDERIIQVTYGRQRPRTGMYMRAGSAEFFRFECPPPRRVEIPMAAINISKWELDLLLYIYKGRYHAVSVPI